MKPVGEPDAANLQVRFDEREVETGHGELLGHRQPKGPATRKASPKLPRHLSTLPRDLGRHDAPSGAMLRDLRATTVEEKTGRKGEADRSLASYSRPVTAWASATRGH